MRIIKWAAEIMEGNLREARRYIEKAYTLKDNDRISADWCKQMAAAHLDFNAVGHSMIKKIIDETKIKNDHPEYVAGMMAVWESKHADMMRESAEIKAMVDTFK